MRVEPIDSRTAREVVEREHYLHRKPTVSYAFGLYENDELVGVCTFGVPAGRAVSVSACPLSPSSVLELNRLWVHDRMPTNSESWFVSRCLQALPPLLLVVSYADSKEGHAGYIYRALNFHYAGWTDMDRKKVCYDYRQADGSYTRKSAPWTKETGLKIPRKPKARYWIATGGPGQKRWTERFCAWPKMSWSEEPPPSEHTYRKPLDK